MPLDTDVIGSQRSNAQSTPDTTPCTFLRSLLRIIRHNGFQSLSASQSLVLSVLSAHVSPEESLLSLCAHQHPQRHEGPDWDVLMIHQLFLCKWQGLHNGSCFVFGPNINEEEHAFAISP